MIYLLTGTAGFIGAKTAEFLLARGHQVVGIDNLNDYYSIDLKMHRLQKLKKNSNFSFKEIDIESKLEIEELFNQNSFDGVVNFAARAGVRASIENPQIYISTNVLGTTNVLDSMRRNGVKKLILASTSSLYAGLQTPYKEDLAVNTPISPYAASKKGAESLAFTYHHLFDFDVAVLRFFTVFGPAGRPDMGYYKFIDKVFKGEKLPVFGNGEASRDYTYVDDIAEGACLALEKVKGYEVINLGGGKNPITVNTLIQMIEKISGKKAIIEHFPMHPADMEITWADISKAQKLLNWSPTIDLYKGLENCIDWYRAYHKSGAQKI